MMQARMMVLAAALAGPLLACPLLTGPALAASDDDPEWPCVQRQMAAVAPGMIWSGPPIESVNGMADDPAISSMAAELAARRTPLEEAEGLVESFAADLEDQRNAKLTALFAATLEIINSDRASLIGGIKRYARGQQALSEKITRRNQQLRELEPSQVLERDALAAERDWDIRIYDDRRHSLEYLCEQPVLLEQRAFALARAIAGHLE